MAVVTSEFIGNENSVEALTKKNDVLGKTIEQLNERLEMQKRFLQESLTAYGEADGRTQQWEQAVNRTREAINKATAEYGQNASALEELSENTDEASEATLSLSDALSDLGIELPTAETLLSAAADAAKAFADWCADAIRESAAFADEILTLSTNFGVSTTTLQEYKYMAELTDTSVEIITGSISRLTRSMNSARDGEGDAAEAFKTLGVEVTNTDGTLRDSEDVFNEIIDALGSIPNETERDALSMSIFGRSAMDLNSLIATGSAGIKEYAEEARNMGYVLSEEQLKTLGEVDDQFQRLDLAMQAAKQQMAAEMAPAIIELTKELINLIEVVDWQQFGKALGDIIHELIPLLDVIVRGIVAIADACDQAGKAIDSASDSLRRLFSVAPRNVSLGHFSGNRASLPGLAEGGVVEPNNPALYILGDNTREREIVAPESLMRQIARESGGGRVEVVVRNPSTTDNQIVRALTPEIDVRTAQRGLVL